MSPDIPVSHNRLIARLPAAEPESLLPHMERVSLALNDLIVVPDEPIKNVYFPLDALLSMVSEMEDGSAVEASSIGREGMSGIPVLLNAETTPLKIVTQIPGQAIRVDAELLKELFERGGELQRLLNRYMYAVILATSQTGACNRLHRIESRLCRWLLMSSDGIGSDELAITHEYLGTMLGVRRAGVTEAIGNLEDAGFISHRRGLIHIVNRPGLERGACECYALVKAEFDRLLN